MLALVAPTGSALDDLLPSAPGACAEVSPSAGCVPWSSLASGNQYCALPTVGHAVDDDAWSALSAKLRACGAIAAVPAVDLSRSFVVFASEHVHTCGDDALRFLAATHDEEGYRFRAVHLAEQHSDDLAPCTRWPFEVILVERQPETPQAITVEVLGSFDVVRFVDGIVGPHLPVDLP